MPNRIIKETIHTSEDVNRMTDFQFRLWISLITYVDDYGRGDARPAIIKGSCFPLRDRITNKDIDDALRALAGIGCVGLYTVDGKPYLYFPTWESHQRIQTRKPKFPDPPENVTVSHGESRWVTVDDGESPLESESNTNPNMNPNPNRNPNDSGCAPRFTPPTVEEVSAYVEEHGYHVDPQRFIDYYQSNGWKVGKNSMKDWKAAVRTWEQKDKPAAKRGRNDWIDEAVLK